MITLRAANVTMVQCNLFWLDKGLKVDYWAVSQRIPVLGLFGGVHVEIDSPEENWQVILPIIVSFVNFVGAPKIRVEFDYEDASWTAGRLAARRYFIYADGTQGET